jgi:3-oxoacyl-[acyl-carrier protein] reductase
MFDGKVAVVTGGSRGIGRAIACMLAAAGANVTIFYAGNQTAAKETLAEMENTGCPGMMLQVDVADREQVETAMKQVILQWGRIDILVNNAGITRDHLLLRLTEENWDQVIQTNLKGAFLCTKAVTRTMMKQRSGRIINVSSVVGVMGNPGQANYVAAKAGVIGFTKAVAKELASRGITVNAIAPGFIQTDMTAILDEEVKKQILSAIPLGRFGTTADVAELVRFLASDAANYITGQTLHIDGGMVMH